MNRQTFRRHLALWIALTVVGCGQGYRPPPQLTPVGDVAFYARRVIQAIDTVVTVAIEAEAAKVLSTADARVVLDGGKIAAQAGVDLSAALKAGATAQTARDKAVKTISSAIDSISKNETLSPTTRGLIEPYLNVVRTLLTIWLP